jgi:hypothetical protein
LLGVLAWDIARRFIATGVRTATAEIADMQKRLEVVENTMRQEGYAKLRRGA